MSLWTCDGIVSGSDYSNPEFAHVDSQSRDNSNEFSGSSSEVHPVAETNKLGTVLVSILRSDREWGLGKGAVALFPSITGFTTDFSGLVFFKVLRRSIAKSRMEPPLVVKIFK